MPMERASAFGSTIDVGRAIQHEGAKHSERSLEEGGHQSTGAGHTTVGHHTTRASQTQWEHHYRVSEPSKRRAPLSMERAIAHESTNPPERAMRLGEHHRPGASQKMESTRL